MPGMRPTISRRTRPAIKLEVVAALIGAFALTGLGPQPANAQQPSISQYGLPISDAGSVADRRLGAPSFARPMPYRATQFSHPHIPAAPYAPRMARMYPNQQVVPRRSYSPPAQGGSPPVVPRRGGPIAQPQLESPQQSMPQGQRALPQGPVTPYRPSDRRSPQASRPALGPPRLAEQPKLGEHRWKEPPCTDPNAMLSGYNSGDFCPDPIHTPVDFSPGAAIESYDGKHLNPTQRPWIEIGRPFYMDGQLKPSLTFLGDSNLVSPQFLLYGDFRTAIASNTQKGTSLGRVGYRLNLDLDFKVTATERFHAFIGPMDRGNQYTRFESRDGQTRFISELDPEFEAYYFEGDLGAIAGGAWGEVLPFDFPFTVGLIPLLFQNGIWLEDAFLGVAATLPARNSPALDISNYDVTFFAGFNEINSPAFGFDDSAASMVGVTTFVEAWGGYMESGYAYLHDSTGNRRGYHNLTTSFTQRIGGLFSNSMRVITNFGQDPSTPPDTAEGVLLLCENSLITRYPSNVVPYFNLFAGFGHPQSVARDVKAGGILRNTGILFETDGVTGYPRLNDTGNQTWGGALGLNVLGPNFSHQLIVEVATVQVMGEQSSRIARGNQYGLGTRYQIPISNAWLIRFDAMYGFLQRDHDLSGVRVELRHKF